MGDKGSILIVDDEDTFLEATAELLRRDGYRCDAASDFREATERLRGQQYDLMIAEVKIPGNGNLKLVHEAHQLAPGMPVILVTGYPSADSAIEAIGLPVVAYLKKPPDDDELRRRVRDAMGRSEIYHALSSVQEHLNNCIRDLETVKQASPSSNGGPRTAFAAISTVTIQSLAACLSQLLNLQAMAGSLATCPDLCQLLSCPRQPVMRNALRQTIRVLERTKGKFKSNELRDLRESLEQFLADHSCES